MKGAGVGVITKAALDKLRGDGPGRVRALLAAAVTGTATAALTYKALRTGFDGDDEE